MVLVINCYDCSDWKSEPAGYDPLVTSPNFKYYLEDLIVEATSFYIAFAGGYVLKVDSNFAILISN